MNQDIQALQKQIDALKNELHDQRFRTKELNDTVLDIVFKDRDLVQATTQTVALTGEVQNITVGKAATGYIKTRYRDNLIWIPYNIF